ncbi:ABC transporter substrate-binding protein [Rhodococcus rhodochrous]|uniref:ABC transporter substrate-binding protein n=1 Tax=Rhodococcus rhodochrous TaxID=1829 RepID=UPI00132F06CB|nr:ABC transporter substrate-binding protein [Rhodococcus rhodochrous]QHG84015.1 Fe3+-citrate ABC transporter substrate-binding protein [Rhodococcus rhodochrous]QOH56305.1 Fe3+-citrate ABC transporter substrate-binding protein [Rhodococcus rhodochrous]
MRSTVRREKRQRGVASSSRWVAAGLIGALAFTAGCSSRDTQEADASTTGDAVTIVDQRGETITLDGPAEKVAFTVMPAPSIFAAVDRSYDRIVGINQSTLVANQGGMFATMFPGSAESTTVAGSDFVPNVETLLELDPDVVVQWGDRGPDVVEPIESAGFPVVGLEYGTQEDLETWITLFAQIAGKPERGEELVAWQRAEIEEMREKVAGQDAPRPRAMILSRNGDAYSTTSATGYDGFQFDLVGADLVTEGFVSDSGQVSPEQILAWDPEVIMLSGFDQSTPADIYADPRLASVSAVQNRRVYKTPLGGYRWQVPSAESPLMWDWMFRILYPQEQSGEFRDDIRAAFDDLFAYEISEDEIDQVLRFDLNRDAASYDQFAR